MYKHTHTQSTWQQGNRGAVWVEITAHFYFLLHAFLNFQNFI